MARVKRGNVARKRRNKILRLARGFRGGNGTLFRTANQRVMKAASSCPSVVVIIIIFNLALNSLANYYNFILIESLQKYFR